MAFKSAKTLDCSTSGCTKPPTRFCNCNSVAIFICDSHVYSHYTEFPLANHRIEDIRLPKDVIETSLCFLYEMKNKIRKILDYYFKNLNQREWELNQNINELLDYQKFYENVINTLSNNSIMPYVEINMIIRKMKKNECLDYIKDSKFFNPKTNIEEILAEATIQCKEVTFPKEGINNSAISYPKRSYQASEDGVRIDQLQEIIKNLENKNKQLSEVIQQNQSITKILEKNHNKINQMTEQILNLQTKVARTSNNNVKRKKRKRNRSKRFKRQRAEFPSFKIDTSFSRWDSEPPTRKIKKISTKDVRYQSIFHWNRLMCFKDNSKTLIINYVDDEKPKEFIEISELPEVIGSQIAMCQIQNEEIFCFGNLSGNNYSGIAFIIKFPYEIKMLKSGTPCYKTSVCLFSSHVYAFGGEYNNQPLNLAERYAMQEKRWDKINKLPVPLSECSTLVLRKHIYIASSSNRSIYKFNPKNKSYMELIILPEISTKFLLSRNAKLFIFDGKRVLIWNKDNEEWVPRQIDYDLTLPISYKIIYNKSVYFVCKDGMVFKFSPKCGLAPFTSFNL